MSPKTAPRPPPPGQFARRAPSRAASRSITGCHNVTSAFRPSLVTHRSSRITVIQSPTRPTRSIANFRVLYVPRFLRDQPLRAPRFAPFLIVTFLQVWRATLGRSRILWRSHSRLCSWGEQPSRQPAIFQQRAAFKTRSKRETIDPAGTTRLPVTNHHLPITNHQSRTTNHEPPLTNHPSRSMLALCPPPV